jgi:hypothetical protein
MRDQPRIPSDSGHPHVGRHPLPFRFVDSHLRSAKFDLRAEGVFLLGRLEHHGLYTSEG